MGHHQVHVLIPPPHGLGVLVAGGPGVEDVAEAAPGDLLEAGDPGLGQELVAGDGVIDIGGDVQRTGELPGHQAPQVGGVVKGGVVQQAVGEVLVHQIAPGDDVGDDAPPAHHGGQAGQVVALQGQPAARHAHPVVQLIVEGGVGGEVRVAVDHAPDHQGPLIPVHRRLGTGGAGVQN